MRPGRRAEPLKRSQKWGIHGDSQSQAVGLITSDSLIHLNQFWVTHGRVFPAPPPGVAPCRVAQGHGRCFIGIKQRLTCELQTPEIQWDLMGFEHQNPIGIQLTLMLKFDEIQAQMWFWISLSNMFWAGAKMRWFNPKHSHFDAEHDD